MLDNTGRHANRRFDHSGKMASMRPGEMSSMRSMDGKISFMRSLGGENRLHMRSWEGENWLHEISGEEKMSSI